MANILGDDKKQQILALGRLGWPLRRIEQATGVRRETASVYLKTAGIAIRAPRRRRLPPKPASPVSTDPANPASEVRPPMAHCHLGLGRLYQRTGDAERADAHLTTARTLYGERPPRRRRRRPPRPNSARTGDSTVWPASRNALLEAPRPSPAVSVPVHLFTQEE